MPYETARQAWHALMDWFVTALMSVPFLVAFMAQLAYHTQQVAASERGPPFWKRMLWVIPTAFVLGQVAAALAAFFALPTQVTYGLSGVLGYYGLSGLHAIAVQVARRKGLLPSNCPEKETDR